ncbi:hypothetical protein CR513_37172, partial [Mucuna pruriens]
MDDIMKSKEKKGHVKNLASVFGVLRRYQLKLNLEKFSFGVKAGKFLGFMLIRRSIEANPKKCNTVIGMRSPKSGKDFSFSGVKDDASLFPILTRSVLGKLVFVYISISDNAKKRVNSALSIMSALQGVELRYQKIEKATLAIVITTKKLRPYLQSHHPELAGRMTGWTVELSEFDIAFERRGHMKA